MKKINQRLRDVLKQGASDATHLVVARRVLVDAIAEIDRLREIEAMYEGLCK